MRFKAFIESDFNNFKMMHDKVRVNVHPGQENVPLDDLKGDTAQFLPTHRHKAIPHFWVMITNNPSKDGFVKFAGKSITNGKEMTGGEPTIDSFNQTFEPLPKKYFGHLN